ncbi:S9 family peptidase [Thioalkalivibrio sp. HK1]|uniref:S9 family peptidase n=1 Tax=Thioalkalivibrio sp. HK1 TaxID=1469245 RepID=UPI0005704BEF|nr:S9 family peptidase [Thioalkalivibrio sp. HK1]
MPNERPDTQSIAPPVAEKRPSAIEMHGRRRSDPYTWLRDENWQRVIRDPAILRGDIKAHLEAENDYVEKILAPVQDLRSDLLAEYKGRISQEDVSVPDPDGDWEYYVRYRQGGQYPSICRRPTKGADSFDIVADPKRIPASEQVLLDGDLEAEGEGYYGLGQASHSFDHRYLAWSVDTKGSEIHTLRIKDLDSGECLSDAVEGCSASFVWASDHRSLIYIVLDESHRPRKVMLHRLGTPVIEDRLVYEEMREDMFLGLSSSASRRFVWISSHDHRSCEIRSLDAMRPQAEPSLIVPRRPDIECGVSDHADRLLILTNDQARDFKIVEAPIDSVLDRSTWRDIVPHRSGVLIQGMQVFGAHLVRLEIENALPRIVVRDLATSNEHAIDFDQEAYSLGIVPTEAFDSEVLRFHFSSMTTPGQIFDYDMRTKERTLRKERVLPSGHDPCDYITRRVVAVSDDGALVPISLVHHRSTPIDGTAPLHLYGYGAYGISIPASFGITALSLVDRGFVHAIAHIRGGMERGYDWYAKGRLEHKTNTFRDFIACAKKLIEGGYADPDRIAIHGGSAGGMLVGACINMAPDLFAAAVAEVPFVDVLNTICDDTLPLTPPEWKEWGNPIASQEDYDRIASYSPFDNIERGRHPHILATAGLTDPRVTWWEPAKWIARLREMNDGNALIALHTNMGAGHGGASGRFDSLEEVALVQAFILHALNRS